MEITPSCLFTLVQANCKLQHLTCFGFCVLDVFCDTARGIKMNLNYRYC